MGDVFCWHFELERGLGGLFYSFLHFGVVFEEGWGWKTVARWFANAWALSMSLFANFPRGVRSGSEGMVTRLRCLLAFHREYSEESVGLSLCR
jgi:hypothetical protein